MDEKNIGNAIEAAKSGAQAIEKIVDIVHRLSARSADKFGEMLSDKVDEWRIRNLHNILVKTEKLLAAAKAQIGGIPPRQFYPMLEAAALEDDATLQELWAALIANAAISESELPSACIEFLKGLSSIEALALNRMWEAVMSQVNRDKSRTGGALVIVLNRDVMVLSENEMGPVFDDLFLARKKGLQLEELPIVDVSYSRAISIANLLRLGILEKFSVGDQLQYKPIHRFEMRYRFTPLGWFFVQACHPIDKSHPKVVMA